MVVDGQRGDWSGEREEKEGAQRRESEEERREGDQQPARASEPGRFPETLTHAKIWPSKVDRSVGAPPTPVPRLFGLATLVP